MEILIFAFIAGFKIYQPKKKLVRPTSELGNVTAVVPVCCVSEVARRAVAFDVTG